MATPLTRIPPGRLRHLAVPAFIVYLLAFVPFLLIGDPQEMLRLQLAGSVSRARSIVSGWSPTEVVDMAFLQGIDNVHPLAYGVLLATGSVWAGRQLRGRWRTWAPVISWAALAAALFDVLENVGMAVMIRGTIDAPVPAMTTAFALAKSSMVLLMLSYILAGVGCRVRRRASAAAE